MRLRGLREQENAIKIPNVALSLRKGVNHLTEYMEGGHAGDFQIRLELPRAEVLP